MLLRSLAFCSAVVLAGAPSAAQAPAAGRIDHILLGVPDLDKAAADLAKVFGVTPVYGGKHPRGTHNALLSLGRMADLEQLPRPQLIGWAVASPDLAALRTQARARGIFAERVPGRQPDDPKGEVLRWQTSVLEDEPAGGALLHRLVCGHGPPGCHLAGWLQPDHLRGGDASRRAAACTLRHARPSGAGDRSPCLLVRADAGLSRRAGRLPGRLASAVILCRRRIHEALGAQSSPRMNSTCAPQCAI